MAVPDHPVRVAARLGTTLSRWPWLVKWILAVPHLVVLFFLWIAFTVVSVIAFFAILFTERHPRALVDFDLGLPPPHGSPRRGRRRAAGSLG